MIHNHTVLPYGVLPKDVINLGTIIGPFFLGHLFNWALYGMLVLQIYLYCLTFGHKDAKYIKIIVAGVFLIDSVSVGFITHAGWRVLVSGWGDVNIINDLDWTWASLPVSTGLVSAIVQHFFAYRIYKFTKIYWGCILISMISLGQLAFAVKTGEIAYYNKSFHYIRELIPSLWLGGSILADILVSGILIYALYLEDVGFTTSQHVIQRLIIVSVETALPTTIVAVIKIILIFTNHDNRHLVFCIVLTRLYSNCLVAALNSRHEMFGGGFGQSLSARCLSQSSGGSSRQGWLKNITSRLSPTSPRSFSGEMSQVIVTTTQTTHTHEYDVELGTVDIEKRPSFTGEKSQSSLPSPALSAFPQGKGCYDTYSAMTPPASAFQAPVHNTRNAYQ